ncbi:MULTISPECIES: heavy-metal-associated domain-containing protein [Zhenhengia]|jgi:copper chaperone|uniref:Heavy-metal-associated domain-containing protein n=1 Tax=Zhenhengia yiwuensis TaxID=2763666 RepID=A0A926ELB2_9FIRM|nr:cation transporter [Zhenhengia yiwuensis]MBC8580422.1 heavy-metal-associated domain-containing protein [Zhenhengia yiwuensis]MBS5798832.1 heavy-metal-associated domain-containing protein [Clostridiales bacterium]MDU6359319.1 cation transporter [Clostridiales bacterium]MDY3369208.1 cation transporter [Zhenhengia yiwuensis]
MKKKIMIEGMSCGHCVKHVQEALEGLNDVSSVEVNLAEKYAVVETTVEDSQLQEAIDDAGYDVISIENL